MTAISTTKKTTNKYKVKPAKRMFNIIQRMTDLTVNEKRKMYLFIAKESGFRKDAIEKNMRLREDTLQTPNYNILKAFAKYFKCTIEELENK